MCTVFGFFKQTLLLLTRVILPILQNWQNPYLRCGALIRGKRERDRSRADRDYFWGKDEKEEVCSYRMMRKEEKEEEKTTAQREKEKESMTSKNILRELFFFPPPLPPPLRNHLLPKVIWSLRKTAFRP